MRRIWTCAITVVALAAAAPALPAQDTTAAERPGQMDPREDQLRDRLLNRFLERASRELELSADQEARLRAEFGEIQEKRRSLIREQRDVRRRLERMSREEQGNDAEAQQLLARAAELKAREAQLWREEQERIGRVLTPRQQARFLMMQERFAERVREMRGQRRPRDARPDRNRPRRPRSRP